MGQRVELPALIDLHVHLRGMHWSHKGDFLSETQAAVAGGYWLVCDMPNTPPETISPDALAVKQADMAAQAVCDYGIYFGASSVDNTAAYSMVGVEVAGLKMYCNETTGDLLIADQAVRERHFAAWDFDKPILVHAEGETVAEILALMRRYRRRTHFVHISTAFEIDLLRAAKAEGLPVTLGVCPHHLWLTTDDLPRLGAFGRMKPGLKSPADREALWDAIADGTVDVVESDHAPHTVAEKRSDRPPYGVPGLPTTVPLMLTAVGEGRLSLERAIDLMSEGPARVLGVERPQDSGCVVDLDAPWVIDGTRLPGRCGWSPYDGMRVTARVKETFIRGNTVYEGGRVVALPGAGRGVWPQLADA
ncbi:MAG: dihydroorotase family protein [Chloroflexi bacterium]|nr:dihydroorotase family protein [Chloroflexota bacterium]